jgi:hypothetical protein
VVNDVLDEDLLEMELSRNSFLNIGDLGFTLNYQATDNLMLRTTYSSNMFGDDEVDNSLIRLQLVYSWHRTSENMKKLGKGH